MKADEYELVTTEEVEKGVRRVLAEDEEGREMMRRANEPKEVAGMGVASPFRC